MDFRTFPARAATTLVAGALTVALSGCHTLGDHIEASAPEPTAAVVHEVFTWGETGERVDSLQREINAPASGSYDTDTWLAHAEHLALHNAEEGSIERLPMPPSDLVLPTIPTAAPVDAATTSTTDVPVAVPVTTVPVTTVPVTTTTTEPVRPPVDTATPMGPYRSVAASLGATGSIWELIDTAEAAGYTAEPYTSDDGQTSVALWDCAPVSWSYTIDTAVEVPLEAVEDIEAVLGSVFAHLTAAGGPTFYQTTTTPDIQVEFMDEARFSAEHPDATRVEEDGTGTFQAVGYGGPREMDNVSFKDFWRVLDEGDTNLYSIVDADVHLSGSELAEPGLVEKFDEIVAHEVMHALGIGHAEDETSLMFTTVTDTMDLENLSDADKAMLALHGIEFCDAYDGFLSR